MTVTDETQGAAAPPPPPPPPPDANNIVAPQVPARSVGPERPQGTPSVSPEPARAQGNGVRWRLVALVVCLPLLFMVGCGVLFSSAGGGDSSTAATSTTAVGGGDELAEVSPSVWYPEYTDTARELIGPGREARLLMAQKVKTIVDTKDEQGRQIATPCELFMRKDVVIEITFQRRYTEEFPVPVFVCPRGADGAYTPPVAPTPTTAAPGAGAVAPTAGSAVAPAKPAGE